MTAGRGPIHKRGFLATSVALFLLNAVLIRELFSMEYLDQMGSIEGAFIGISRYLLDHWRDLSWFPLWYGGIPFQDTYPPLLHSIVAMAAGWTGHSPALAYHAVTAIVYCLGSVAVFWLAYELSGHWLSSFVAGLLYSLLSPSAMLVSAIRQDVGGVFGPRRLQDLVQYGEGPHLLSLVLLPVAIIAIHRLLERRRPLSYCWAAVSVATVALSNYLGLFALAVMTLCLLLARAAGIRDWVRVLLAGAAAYALASPWILPSTLLVVQTNAQSVGGAYRMGFEQVGYLAVGLLGLLAVAVLLERRRCSLDLRFWVLNSLAFGGITMTAFWFGKFLMPQPERYHLQMEMVLAGLAAVLCLRLGSRPRWVLGVVMIALSALCLAGALHVRQWARDHIHPLEISHTVEYRMAQWLAQNAPGERVFLPGSSSVWLNAFGSQPQLLGGFDQGLTNRLLPRVRFQTYSGTNAGNREGAVAVALLKALGVQWVAAGGGPDSKEFYKPYQHPAKFDGLLPEVWREGGDALYRIPQRSNSLAHVMRLSDLPEQMPDVTHTEVLQPYLDALDNVAYPAAAITWRRPGAFTVTVDMQPGQIVSLQITYDAGWKARTGSKAITIGTDHLGQMAFDPGCTGPCTTEFEYTGGREAQLARIASFATMLAGLAWLVISTAHLVV